MLVCNVVGARPNFMKMAPIVLELRQRGIPQILVHTGQHYDDAMSGVFFQDLGLPAPDVHLGAGSGSHARQTAQIMTSFEEVLKQHRPTLVIVAGDVNSTVAVALVAAKERVMLAHVEAGLRSFDRTMPEEINRIVTDHLSQLLFTTEKSGDENLRREGLQEGIRFVGNCMVDSLRKHVASAVLREPWRARGVAPGEYALLTLHRPANVDEPETLAGLLIALEGVASRLPVVFPVHPRTRESMARLRPDLSSVVRLTNPLPYLDFLGLMAKARLVLTDSGGIQEETTALGVPCMTLRANTERPVTISEGTNRLVGTDPAKIREGVDDVLGGKWPAGVLPPLWDGRAGVRIVDTVEKLVSA